MSVNPGAHDRGSLAAVWLGGRPHLANGLAGCWMADWHWLPGCLAGGGFWRAAWHSWARKINKLIFSGLCFEALKLNFIIKSLVLRPQN